MRVVCLISGGGSNLQALIDWQTKGLLGDAEIVGVVSNNVDAPGLERAKKANIPVSCLPHHHYPDRIEFDRALMQLIDGYQPDLIVLAGFMRILAADFVNTFPTINSHPALLPDFPGAHAVRDALAAGVSVTGTTVHWVDAGVDTGPIITQMEVPVLPNDDEATLHERIKKVERGLIVATIALIIPTLETNLR